jgi:hypothetical protein
MSDRWAIAFALACGCGATAPAQRPAAPVAPDPNAEEVTLSAVAPPLLVAEIALLEPGAQPRKTLRYHPQAGRSQSVVVELATALTLAVGEMSPPEVRTPVIHLAIDLQPRFVDGGGTLTLQGTLSRVEILPGTASPAVATALAADLDRLAQARFTARITSRGVMEDLAFAPAADASVQLATAMSWIREALRLLLPPLPEEPVGPGARWQARRRIQLGAAAASEQAVYTLATVTETRLRLGVKLRLSAGEQNPTVAGLPPGATLKLTSLAGAGAGTIELDVAQLQPRTNLRWSATAVGSTEPAGEPPAPVRMVTTVELAVRPGERGH